ncbi:uncharacterized protein J3R85_000176 [Psidium guajava]|nr:uncharacterized protein J3R85_000176 [Psidium guajava]
MLVGFLVLGKDAVSVTPPNGDILDGFEIQGLEMLGSTSDSHVGRRRTHDPRKEVIQAWYMDDSDEDQRLPHHREPKEFVSLKQLEELGVLSWRLDADNYETDEELKKIREERGYSYMDFCEVCPEKLPNYEEKIKNFFEEHLHTDEEIRYCVAGSGYFDVRDQNDAWIRVWVKKGGMIVLPAGMYHRFTLDSDNYIKAMRLFVGDPVWTPFNRPHDHLPARKEYLQAFMQKECEILILKYSRNVWFLGLNNQFGLGLAHIAQSCYAYGYVVSDLYPLLCLVLVDRRMNKTGCATYASGLFFFFPLSILTIF